MGENKGRGRDGKNVVLDVDLGDWGIHHALLTRCSQLQVCVQQGWQQWPASATAARKVAAKRDK